jgi:hypothetical protein
MVVSSTETRIQHSNHCNEAIVPGQIEVEDSGRFTAQGNYYPTHDLPPGAARGPWPARLSGRVTGLEMDLTIDSERVTGTYKLKSMAPPVFVGPVC